MCVSNILNYVFKTCEDHCHLLGRCALGVTTERQNGALGY